MDIYSINFCDITVLTIILINCQNKTCTNIKYPKIVHYIRCSYHRALKIGYRVSPQNRTPTEPSKQGTQELKKEEKDRSSIRGRDKMGESSFWKLIKRKGKKINLQKRSPQMEAPRSLRRLQKSEGRPTCIKDTTRSHVGD